MEANRLHRPTRDFILTMIRQGPCTIRQIADTCHSSSYDVVRYLSDMVRHDQIMVKSVNGQLIVSSGTMDH